MIRDSGIKTVTMHATHARTFPRLPRLQSFRIQILIGYCGIVRSDLLCYELIKLRFTTVFAMNILGAMTFLMYKITFKLKKVNIKEGKDYEGRD